MHLHTLVSKDNIVIFEVTKLYKSDFFLYFFSLQIEGSGTVIPRGSGLGICADNSLNNEDADSDPDSDPER